MNELKIDLEFKALIPSLTDEEHQQLTDNIVKEGCRDALIFWNRTIIDGHNRYEICNYHNIAFKTEEKFFDTRDEAKEWIIRNQFGRRNLSDYNRSVLALKLKSLISAKAKERQLSGLKNQSIVPQHVAERGETREEIAKIAGVSHETIRRVDLIQKEAPKEVQEKVAKGEMSIRQGYYSIRPKKEDKPVEKAPDEPKIEETEVKKKSPELTEDVQEKESIFSITLFKTIVNNFRCDINPLAYGEIIFSKMGIDTRNEYLNEINEMRNWFDKIENEIKSTF